MHIYREKPPSSLLEKEVSFMELYRATALQRGNSFPSCAWRNIYFRTRFSWFDHIFTTNSWQNIFVWFSYHILRQRLMVYNLQFSLQLLLRRITLPLILQYLPSDGSQPYTLLFFSWCTYLLSFVFFCITSQTAVMPVVSTLYFLFRLLTMIFHSVRRVGFHLYMTVSTLQLTSIRNLSEYWQLLLEPASRCRSIFDFPVKIWLLKWLRFWMWIHWHCMNQLRWMLLNWWKSCSGLMNLIPAWSTSFS